MRKIKSVKLKNDYRDKLHFICEGSELTNNNTCYWWLYNSISFHEDEIKENKTDLFAIEYEPEGFELKRYTEYGFLDYDSFMKRELNRLADWCDGQSERNDNILYTGIYVNEHGQLKATSYLVLFFQCLKLNSPNSADLFITELNKPENSEYKNYFVELLKKTRL